MTQTHLSLRNSQSELSRFGSEHLADCLKSFISSRKTPLAQTQSKMQDQSQPTSTSKNFTSKTLSRLQKLQEINIEVPYNNFLLPQSRNHKL